MSEKVKEGIDAEMSFVKELNENKNDPRWKDLGFEDATNYFAIWVSTLKDSKIHGKKVPCKSDVFIAKAKDNAKIGVYFLNEDDIKKNELEPIDATGISIKKPNVENIQWQKFGIHSVREIFGDTELGAGISLYRSKGTNHQSVDESLKENRKIIEKWCGGLDKFEEFYSDIDEIEILNDGSDRWEKKCDIAKKVVEKANEVMMGKIDSEEDIRKKIFWGIGVFDEPFCASWIYEDERLKSTRGYYPKYQITTGSSRMKNYTIAIKSAK